MKKTSIAKCFGIKKNAITMWEKRINENKKSNLRTKVKLSQSGNGRGIVQSFLHTESGDDDQIMQVSTYIKQEC